MKTLIFGPANAGKTSLMRTTCQGYTFMRVMNIPATRGISRENYLFRGLLEITIWDAGGQEKYMNRYFSEGQREIIFSEVEIPVFMVDATVEDENQLEKFTQFVDNILEFSPDVKNIFVLINKTDLEEANHERTFKTLSENLSPELKKICVFTPVSVKEGTAQYRLIEILDQTLQEDVLKLEKLGKIRKILDSMKSATGCEYVIFNRPDGLVTTSTFGNVKADPLNFLSLDIGSLESNLDQIFGTIQERMGQMQEPLMMAYTIYETGENYVILREMDDYAMLMTISLHKKVKTLQEVLPSIADGNADLDALKKLLQHR